MLNKVIDKQVDPDTFETLTFDAMNTTFYFVISQCKISNWKDVIEGWVRYVEMEWSRFQGGDNELGQLNNLEIGQKMNLSLPLYDVLQRADDYRQKTNSSFSPYLLSQIQYHGYQLSFPFPMNGFVKEEVIPPLIDSKTSPFLFDPKQITVTRTSEGKVDLGGIGKGYTVQAAAKWLKHIGGASAGMVDGGGDMTVWSDGLKEWKIGVAHPLQKNREIAQFRLKNGSIATSNVIYRSWTKGNEVKHHILNGKTGFPAENHIIQATVISENCLDAEVGAKLCLIEEVKNIKSQLKKISSAFTYLLVNDQGKVISGRLEELM